MSETPKTTRIAICGNIGVGKSTLCLSLASKYSEGKYMKENLDNPHLTKFYDYMSLGLKCPNPHSFKL